MSGVRWTAVPAALVVALVLCGVATGAPVTWFDPSFQEVTVYETCQVAVAINDEILGVTGYDFLIGYDPLVVEPVGVAEGSLPAGYDGDTFLYWDIDEMNRLLVNGALLGGSVDGPGTLVLIEFMGLADGTSEVLFVDGEMRDIENNAIATGWQGASIQVLGAVPVERCSWTSIKALFD